MDKISIISTISFLSNGSPPERFIYIKSRISSALTKIVEPLIPFFSKEGISEQKQYLIIETCKRELTPLIETPEFFFKGSLNGDKIFTRRYSDGNLPQEIHDEELESVYGLLFPRIAEILCRIPEILEDWEQNAWAENYRRLDSIALELRDLFKKIDAMKFGIRREEDKLFTLVRQTMAQAIAFSMDITGLRADRPFSGAFENFYVHPCLSIREKKQSHFIEIENDCFLIFSQKQYPSVVTGVAGAGKTTWATWLQRKALGEDSDFLPIRVNLREKTGKAFPSIHELVRDAVGIHLKEELSPDLLRKWFSANKILFIFDGFDEIPPSARDQFLDWIKNIHTSSEYCPVTITSRPLTTPHLESLEKKWSHWMIEPFDEKRISHYITQWYKYSPLLADTDRDVDADGITKKWMGDPTIKPLTENPLFLSTLLMT